MERRYRRGGGMSRVDTEITPIVPWYLSGGIATANCVAAYQPKGAASLAESYINLVNPGTYNLIEGVAPTWNATDGWIASGTCYLDTSIATPHNGWSIISKFSGANGNGSVCGDQNSIGSYFILQPRNAGVFYFYGDNFKSSTAISSGVIAICGSTGYKDGNVDVTAIGTYSGTSTDRKIYLLAYQDNTGVAGAFFTGKNQAVSIYNITLTTPQVLALTNAMNAL